MTLEINRKVTIDEIKPIYINVLSASCYPIQESDNIIYYAGIKHNDSNKLKVKLIYHDNIYQLQLVVIGTYHKERQSYNKTENWSSWIRINIDIQNINFLIEQLNNIKKEITKEKDTKLNIYGV
jgi:hypothetical protein